MSLWEYYPQGSPYQVHWQPRWARMPNPHIPTLLLAPVCSQVHLGEQVLVGKEWGLKTGYDGWQEGHHKLVYSGKQKRGFKSQPGVL